MVVYVVGKKVSSSDSVRNFHVKNFWDEFKRVIYTPEEQTPAILSKTLQLLRKCIWMHFTPTERFIANCLWKHLAASDMKQNFQGNLCCLEVQ